MNRPLGRIEDLGRELVRSLRPELAARVILLPKAPSDFVTANRTDVTDGNRVIPLAGIYRDARFPDPVEQAKLQSLSDVIEEDTELSDADHDSVAYSSEPKGVPAAASTPNNGRCYGHCWAPTSTAPRPGCPRCTATTTNRPSMPSTSHGRDRRPPASRTTTGCKVPRLLIEWDNTQHNANHAHSVWRDPTLDFGLDLLARHRAAHHV